jgi:hypothetical protein
MLDVLGAAYGDTPKYLWSIAAGNVLLHVGRLEKLGKLPKVSVKPSKKIRKRASLQSSRSIRRKWNNLLQSLPETTPRPSYGRRWTGCRIRSLRGELLFRV